MTDNITQWELHNFFFLSQQKVKANVATAGLSKHQRHLSSSSASVTTASAAIQCV